MNFKSLPLLVVFGLALGCTLPMVAKKGNKITVVKNNVAKAVSAVAESVQPEADIAYIMTDVYEFASPDVKLPELDYPTELPVVTQGLEKADKAIYKAFDAFKGGLNTVISTVKQPVVYKSAIVASIIALPVIVAVYVNNAQKNMIPAASNQSQEKLDAKASKLENQTLTSFVKKAKKALLF